MTINPIYYELNHRAIQPNIQFKQIKMAQTTVGFGIFLLVLGIIGFSIKEMQTITSLLPSFFGLAFLILGIIAQRESLNKIALFLAMVVGLVGLILTSSELFNLFLLLTGTEVALTAAIITHPMMDILCIYYLGSGINSYIDARKNASEL